MIEIVNSKPDKDGKTFSAVVHKELLCFFSPYYTAALKGGFSEAKKDTITIDLEFDLMRDLVSWLYTGNFTRYESSHFLDLYLFADEKMMLALRRSIMTVFVGVQEVGYKDMDEDETIAFLQQLPATAGLFRYLVDYWVVLWSQGHFDCEVEGMDSEKQIPKAFFYQALRRFSRVASSKAVRKSGAETLLTDSMTNACNYHEHVSKEEWKYSESTVEDEYSISCADESGCQFASGCIIPMADAEPEPEYCSE